MFRKSSLGPLFKVSQIASLVLLFGSAPLPAATFVSNLGESAEAFGALVGDYGLGTSGVYARAAQSFTAGSSTILGSATLNLASGGSNTTQFRVDIYSNNADNPGVSLAQLTGPGNPTPGPNTWTGSVPLTAGTKYWVVTSVTAFPFPASATGQSKNWAITNSLSQTGDSGWSIGDDYRASFNNGGTWDAFSDSALMLSLDSVVAAVPEPTRGMLCIAGIAGLMLRRKRRDHV